MLDEKALRRLIDKDSIAEVVSTRYARALDWGDMDMLKSCFHPDAVIDYGIFKGNAHAWLEKQNAHDPALINQFHYCFPPQIEVSGDKAQSEGNCLAGRRFRTEGKEGQRLIGSRYLDSLDRRDTGWKISSRIVLVEFIQSFDGIDTMPMRPGQPGFEFMSNASPAHPLYRPLYGY